MLEAIEDIGSSLREVVRRLDTVELMPGGVPISGGGGSSGGSGGSGGGGGGLSLITDSSHTQSRPSAILVSSDDVAAFPTTDEDENEEEDDNGDTDGEGEGDGRGEGGVGVDDDVAEGDDLFPADTD
jgi:hypothetical protein